MDNDKSTQLFVSLSEHIENSIYTNKEKAKQEIENTYKKIIEKHLETISKLEYYNENVDQLRLSIIKTLDKKYLPKAKRTKTHKPELTDEQKQEKKQQAQKRKEENKDKPKSSQKKTKACGSLFAIPILISVA